MGELAGKFCCVHVTWEDGVTLSVTGTVSWDADEELYSLDGDVGNSATFPESAISRIEYDEESDVTFVELE